MKELELNINQACAVFIDLGSYVICNIMADEKQKYIIELPDLLDVLTFEAYWNNKNPEWRCISHKIIII